MAKTKGEQTRVRILEVATDLYFEQGLHHVSTAQIAAAAGLTQPALYVYFRNQEDLILAALEHWIFEAQTVIDQKSLGTAAALQQLQSVIEQNLRYSSRHRRKDSLFFALFQSALTKPSALQLYRKFEQVGTDRLMAILIKGQTDLSWELTDPLLTARLIHTLLMGEIIKMLLQPREFGLDLRIANLWTGILALTGL